MKIKPVFNVLKGYYIALFEDWGDIQIKKHRQDGELLWALRFSNNLLVNCGYTSKGTNGTPITATLSSAYITTDYAVSIQRIQEGTYCKEGSPCLTTKAITEFHFIVRASSDGKNEALYNYSWITLGY